MSSSTKTVASMTTLPTIPTQAVQPCPIHDWCRPSDCADSARYSAPQDVAGWKNPPLSLANAAKP